MAKTFEVEMKRFPAHVEDIDTTAAAIETWLDALSIGNTDTVYEITVNYKSGFWIVTAIFEE